MQSKHSALSSRLKAALRGSRPGAVHPTGVETDVESALRGPEGSQVSRHRVPVPISLSALQVFQETCTQQAQAGALVFVGTNDDCIVLSAPEKPPPPPQLQPQRAVKRSRSEPAQEEIVRASADAERLAYLNGELDTVPQAHRDLMAKTLASLHSLRSHAGFRAVESLSTSVRDMPPPSQQSGLTRKKALLVTARLAPGAVVTLRRLMQCVPNPVDGQLCCFNGHLLDQQALPVGAHARAAMDLGLTTLQLVCSVGVPFEPLEAPPETEEGGKRQRLG